MRTYDHKHNPEISTALDGYAFFGAKSVVIKRVKLQWGLTAHALRALAHQGVSGDNCDRIECTMRNRLSCPSNCHFVMLHL